MTNEQFTYWLQGFVELHGGQPNPSQWKMIKEHLKTVFKKITPDVVNLGQGTIQVPYPTTDPYPPFHSSGQGINSGNFIC